MTIEALDGSAAPAPWPIRWRPQASDALGAFVAGTRPWGSTQVPLSVDLTAALWAVALTSLAAIGWAVAVLTGARRCDGFFCFLTTLGGRPGLLVVLGGCSALALLGFAVVTGGLTRAGGGQLAMLTGGAVLGVGALLGAVLALLLVVVAIVLVVGLLAVLLEHS